MSSATVDNCATCFKTVKGKQDYAICVKCSKRVHRKCYDDCLSDSSWTRICQSFTCTVCEAGTGQHFNSNYCSDGERWLVIEESMEINVSTSVPPPTVGYEIIIGASRKGGDIISDGCGHTYGFLKDSPSLRVWRCTFRGCVEFSRCNATLKQIKRPGVDFLRTYSQRDFTLNSTKAHSHPPKRQLTIGQPSSTNSGASLNFGNISTDEAVRVSIDYQDNHINNSQVETAKRKRCPDQRQTNKKQSIAFSIDELFGDNM